MRQLSSLQLPFPPFSPFLHQQPPSLPFPPRFSPPADLALFPMAKLDPRLFRVPFPEEPKPQHSYIGLISMAILSSPEKKLVLADIYQYILDNYLYFRHRGPGWRNSIPSTTASTASTTAPKLYSVKNQAKLLDLSTL